MASTTQKDAPPTHTRFRLSLSARDPIRSRVYFSGAKRDIYSYIIEEWARLGIAQTHKVPKTPIVPMSKSAMRLLPVADPTVLQSQ